MLVLVKRTVFETGCQNIVSILSEVEADVLEEKVITIFKKLGCNIPTTRIEACHRIIKKNRSHSQIFAKKGLPASLRCQQRLVKTLPGKNKLFINKRLCPYYKVIGAKSKKLHSLDKIHSFFISGDTIKIRVNKNSTLLSFTHVDDFGKYFPDGNIFLIN